MLDKVHCTFFSEWNFSMNIDACMKINSRCAVDISCPVKGTINNDIDLCYPWTDENRCMQKWIHTSIICSRNQAQKWGVLLFPLSLHYHICIRHFRLEQVGAWEQISLVAEVNQLQRNGCHFWKNTSEVSVLVSSRTFDENLLKYRFSDWENLIEMPIVWNMSGFSFVFFPK